MSISEILLFTTNIHNNLKTYIMITFFVSEQHSQEDSLSEILVIEALNEAGKIIKRAEYGCMIDTASGKAYYPESKLDLYANKLTGFEGERTETTRDVVEKIEQASKEIEGIVKRVFPKENK